MQSKLACTLIYSVPFLASLDKHLRKCAYVFSEDGPVFEGIGEVPENPYYKCNKQNAPEHECRGGRNNGENLPAKLDFYQGLNIEGSKDHPRKTTNSCIWITGKERPHSQQFMVTPIAIFCWADKHSTATILFNSIAEHFVP